MKARIKYILINTAVTKTFASLSFCQNMMNIVNLNYGLYKQQ